MKAVTALPTGWWINLPAGQLIRLDGAQAYHLARSLDPLPPDAPAVISYSPVPGSSVDACVAQALNVLERVAIEMFPAWLPDAAGIAGPQGAGEAAVRLVARNLAANTEHFGPFLAELAVRALRGRPVSTSRFSTEQRAAGLARVMAASFHRSNAALLIDMPGGLTENAEHCLVAAARWLVHHGHFTIWLTGAPLRFVDWVSQVTVDSGPNASEVAPPSGETPDGSDREEPFATAPAEIGKPRANSAAEKALELALKECAWATGRKWNSWCLPHPLAAPISPDLLWENEMFIVEIDGSDHRRRAKFAQDRTRDAGLMLAGYVVLRFTNEQVLHDMSQVLSIIQNLLTNRRNIVHERQQNA